VMYSAYQDREELEDNLYQEDGDSDVSEANSELEFHLYSQLHYSSNAGELDEPEPGAEEKNNRQESQEGGALEKTTDEDAKLRCTKQSNPTSSTDDHLKTKKDAKKKKSKIEPKIPNSESSESESESEPLDSSDVDDLENWMILGQGRQDGDQSISLNVEGGSYSGSIGGPFLSSTAQIFNKGQGVRIAVQRMSNRYYTGKNVHCRNCNKTGHLSKNCPHPKKMMPCFLCGTMGHQAINCPNKHCNNCGQPGHLIRSCNEKSYWHKQCHRCSMRGHFFDDCPEIWRQYHITTKKGPPVKQGDDGAPSAAYCYNCSKKGHFGYECTKQRMFSGVFPSYPFISHYDTVKDINRRQHRMEIKARGKSHRDSFLFLKGKNDFPRGGGPQGNKEEKMRKKKKGFRTKQVSSSIADHVFRTGGERSQDSQSSKKNQTGQKKRQKGRSNKTAKKQLRGATYSEEDNLFLIKQRKRSK
uniref:Zinc finger CCHC domain-containing protein 7 n=1 Tax=Xiphophorus maculatus TaxID=8083 RepID=A0A3B5QM15_XIPMA